MYYIFSGTANHCPFFPGKIKKIQGFLGSKNSLLDTRPKFSAADTLAALKRYWRHDNLGDNVDWRIDASQLQILPSVSSVIKKSFVTFFRIARTVPNCHIQMSVLL